MRSILGIVSLRSLSRAESDVTRGLPNQLRWILLALLLVEHPSKTPLRLLQSQLKLNSDGDGGDSGPSGQSIRKGFLEETTEECATLVEGLPSLGKCRDRGPCGKAERKGVRRGSIPSYDKIETLTLF
jgi:hypothetical protein